MTHHTESAGKRATVTFHTSPETKARLEKLAQATRRSKSFLSNEALESYLAEEESFIASIERGLTDIKSARTHTTKAARKRVKVLLRKQKTA